MSTAFSFYFTIIQLSCVYYVMNTGPQGALVITLYPKSHPSLHQHNFILAFRKANTQL